MSLRPVSCVPACLGVSGQVVRDRLLEHRKKEKASYGGLFDKGPMYNDKEVRRILTSTYCNELIRLTYQVTVGRTR